MADTGVAGRAGRNGRSANGASGNGASANGAPERGTSDHASGGGSARAPHRSLLSRALRGVASQAQRRIPRADLDERDPDYIRERLPLLWLFASLWYRGEVRGLGNIPDEGPVLLVGNHSGGNMTPDTVVFALAFSTYFGVERPFYQLAHNLVLSMPGAGLRCASSAPSPPRRATPARRSTPGPRCSSTPAATTRSTGRAGSAIGSTSTGARASSAWRSTRACRSCPVVSIGGQETALFLSRGERLAQLLALDRMFRLKVLPISIALPWGLNVGDMLGHIPLPAKLTIETLPPIDLRPSSDPIPISTRSMTT